ncbi:MAG: aspartate kinase, partial [Flavobacteriaceae bacterium]
TAAKGSEEYKKAFKTLEERHLEPINAFLKGDAKASAESFLHQQLEELKTLLDAIHKVEEMTPKSVATISSFGEFLSSTIIEKVLQAAGLNCQLQDARTLIQTKMQQQKEVVDFGGTAAQVQAAWKAHQGEVLLVPGFIAANENGQTTTLGRGGSDYSAAIIAHVLEAEELEIWTDVSGMYTAHPKIVPTATPIEQLTYFEAMELSYFGAKVIYPPTLQPLVEKNIPIRVKNTFDAQAAGSLINGTGTLDQNHIVKGISHIDGVTLISLEGGGMVGIPGFSKRLFEALSENKINIIMITQASSEYSICLGIREGDAPLAKEVIDAQFAFEIAQKKVAPAKVETNLVNIAVVGDRMKDHQGVSGKL